MRSGRSVGTVLAGAVGWVAIGATVALVACHSPAMEPEPRPAAGTYPLDGIYTFRIDYKEGTRAQVVLYGEFVIADSEVLWSRPQYCEDAEAPQGSEGNEESWFDCRSGSYTRERLQLRINRTDPINKSRWYADVRIIERVRACARYASTSRCERYTIATVSRYVPRSGKLDVARGLPGPPPDGPAAVEWP